MCSVGDVTCLSSSIGVAASTFANAVQYMLASQCLMTEKWPEGYQATDSENFDFIIVGAGSAGSALANRLSEIDCWNILLVEAGGDPPIESTIPYCENTFSNTECDWNLTTTDNGITNKANVDNVVRMTRGKGLGGCSSINAMYYVRGCDRDYQAWYDVGLPEWNLTTVKKYFKKFESLQDMKLRNESSIISEFYGSEGPVTINTSNSTYRELTEEMLVAWKELGVPTVRDLNVANVMGAGISRMTAANGVRQSTAHSYLRTAQHRQNLKILKNALVTKMLITNNNNTYAATGVEVQHNGSTINIYANKEVIVSAGSLKSPQLLMLSGIGPKEHLESKNVTCFVNSPKVGQDLHDHAVVPVTIYGDESEYTSLPNQDLDTIKYIIDRTGHMSHGSSPDIIAFYAQDDNATCPDYQTHMNVFQKNSSLISNSFSYYKDSVINSMIEQNLNNILFVFYFILLQPYSRGNVSLHSNNPNDKPNIYWNNYEDSRDLESAVKGIKKLTGIVNTTPFQSVNGFLGRINYTDCNEYDLDSEDYWSCICISMTTTIWHPVGTCKMGTDSNDGVVNSRLQVYGVDNLRVIDASVMRRITSGNTNAPSIMIGERGADLIKEDYHML